MDSFFRYFWQQIWREPDGKIYGLVVLSGGLLMLLLFIYTSTLGGSQWEDRLTKTFEVYLRAAVPFAFVLYGLAALLPRTWRKPAGVLRLTGVVLCLVALIAFVFLIFALPEQF